MDLEFTCVMGAAWDLMYLMERYRYATLALCVTLPSVFSSVSTSALHTLRMYVPHSSHEMRLTFCTSRP